jgi:hypothetical protein
MSEKDSSLAEGGHGLTAGWSPTLATLARLNRGAHHYTLLEGIDGEVCFYCVDELV